jgi:hypothetical protein
VTVTERWRSKEARDLVRVIRAAGGEVERVGTGRLKVTGPKGSVTIAEPGGGGTRRDLRRSSAVNMIKYRTGLDV